MGMKRYALFAAIAALLAFPPAGMAMEKGHGDMKGHGEMKGEAHGAMKMGDRIFGGKIGPWTGEARLVDMKAQMEKMKGAHKKMEGMKSHHISVELSDPATKKPVIEGKGVVTVTGPDKSVVKTELMAMGGHLGADLDLPKPGKYTFKVAVESGGKKGSAEFSHIVR